MLYGVYEVDEVYELYEIMVMCCRGVDAVYSLFLVCFCGAFPPFWEKMSW